MPCLRCSGSGVSRPPVLQGIGTRFLCDAREDYGSARLIGLRFGPNVPRAFDGGLARAEAGLWRTDAFFMRPVENNLHDFDDRTDGSQEIGSLYATRRLPTISTTSGLDLFYISYANTMAEYERGVGAETRHTLGTRLFGSRGNWKWDFEGHFQFGTFGTGDILAWSIASDTRYTFADLPFKPFVELRANAISGDKNPNDPELNSRPGGIAHNHGGPPEPFLQEMIREVRVLSCCA